MTLLQLRILITLNAVTMVLILLFNSAILYGIRSTKESNSVAMRIIQYLSMSDCGVALIVQPTLITKLSLEVTSCSIETVIQFLQLTVPHIPAYIAILMAYERYHQMKNITNSNQSVEIRQINIGIVFIVFTSFLHGILYAFASYVYIFYYVSVAAVILDTVLLSFVFIAYFLTISTVKKQKDNARYKDILVFAQSVVTRLASKILISIVFLYFPYIALTIMRPFLMDDKDTSGRIKGWFFFALDFSYFLVASMSVVNPVTILSINRKIRKIIAKRFVEISQTTA